MSTLTAVPRELEEEVLSLPEPWRWTRDDYHRALELGFFEEDDKIELIDGEIYPVSPQSREHFKCICRAANALEHAFGPGFSVEPQGPAAMNARSEPEPDVMVVRGDFEDFDDHPDPSAIVLVLEVSDSSLAKDRQLKGELYARSGIGDYWVVNLKTRELEVRRDPAPVTDDPGRFAFRYLRILTEDEEIVPLEAGEAAVKVADLFRRQQ